MSPWDCDHEVSEVRAFTQSDKRVVYKPQCLRCGKTCGAAVKRETLSAARPVPKWDHELGPRFNAVAEAAYRKEDERRTAEWFKRHNEYLAGPQWAVMRARALKRDKFLCQGCGMNLAQEVHHKTYERHKNEMLFDLVSVCLECHKKLKVDR